MIHEPTKPVSQCKCNMPGEPICGKYHEPYGLSGFCVGTVPDGTQCFHLEACHLPAPPKPVMDALDDYPSEHDIEDWLKEYFSPAGPRAMRYEAFLAMKACDWARSIESAKDQSK